MFSLLYDRELTELCEELSIPSTGSKEALLEELMKIPWDENEKAVIISESLGLPGFLLKMGDYNADNVPKMV
ncbi:hypothetical protein KA005_22775, partial [bacterium]|nr:hypothetical protein [bacterium]